jgi:hypothetical protein
MADVKIPIKTQYDGRGFNQLERDAHSAQQTAMRNAQEQMRALKFREQLIANSAKMEIQSHQRVTALTARLDKDLASERKKQVKIEREWGQAALVATGVLVKAGFDAVQAARESIAADRELLGILNSTGKGAAGFKDQLAVLATALEDNSNFTDEAVTHAQGLLLTFDKVGRDVIPRATQATADLAELMDGDLQGAAIAVGKALDGQISALKRSGISFTAAEEERIAALFKAGRAAEAQNVILAKLEKQVAGQAKVARDAAGGMKDMEVSAGRLQEAMGGLLLTIGSGVATDFASGFLDKLAQGAKAWEGAIENMRILAEARERAAKEMGIAATARRGAFGQVAGSAISDEALAKAVSEVAEEHRKAKEAADQYAKTLKQTTDETDDNTTATDKNSDALDRAAEAAKRAEAAQAARKDAARGLIEIQKKAAEDTKKTWGDYFKAEAEEWENYQENVAAIQKRAADEQAQIQKTLVKDLAKEHKSAAADIAKIEKGLARDISRKQQDQARQERQQARQRRIDARGDERLFQFDMRQLAAEGAFNQIQEAMGRRAIEKQIEAEKQVEEDRTATENSRVEIDRMRQDAADAKTERQAQAEERMQELRDQAAEALTANQERLQEELGQEKAAHMERLDDLRKNRDERLAEIQETAAEETAALAEKLTENKDLTRKEMEETKALAAALGEETGAAYAEGMNEGFEKNQRINELANEALAGQGNQGPRTNPATGGNWSPPASASAPITRGPVPAGTSHGPRRRFASGGAFTVGGAGGVDSQLVSFWASPNEVVTVQPQGQGGQITVNVNGIGGEQLAAIIRRKVEQGVAEYHDTVIVPWSNG